MPRRPKRKPSKFLFKEGKQEFGGILDKPNSTLRLRAKQMKRAHKRGGTVLLNPPKSTVDRRKLVGLELSPKEIKAGKILIKRKSRRKR